jgi:hypothetical protein
MMRVGSKLLIFNGIIRKILINLEIHVIEKRNENQMLKHDCAALRRQKRSSRARKNIKITEIRTYVPLSHDYADLFANLVASLELCAAIVELGEFWRDKLKDENSKQLVQHMIKILYRYLGYPEGRAFSLYQHRKKQEFLKIAKRIRTIQAYLQVISVNERNLSHLEKIESELNQLARNCRMEIARLAKTETVEYET